MIKCTIEDLYNFEKQTGSVINNFKVETRYGMKSIEAVDITSYNSPIMETKLRSGISIKTSPDHRLWSNDWIPVKDLNVGDLLLTKNGKDEIISCELLNYKDDLYDIQVKDVHEFYANDFVSHNSVVVCALNYALFGKPFRKTTLPNLVNVHNGKELEVELDFESNGKSYKIQRGIKPNKFNILCNGELLNQDSHKRDYQGFLESDIYKFNENMFHQVGVKSLTKYESFLTLPKNRKRHIIEELFDITVISEMFELNKIEKNRLESVLYNLIRDREHQKQLIENEKENIQKLKAIQEKFNTESQLKHQKIQQDIVECENSLNEYQKGLDIVESFISKKKESLEELKKLKSIKTKLQNELDNLKIRMQLFDEKIIWLKSKCPTCLRVDEIELEDDVKIDKKEISKLNGKCDVIDEKIKDLNEKIEKYTSIINKQDVLKDKIQTNKKLITSLKAKLKTKTDFIEIDESKYNDLVSGLSSIKRKIKKTEKDIDYSVVIYELLQDEGIKAYIIRKYLPLLNKLLNMYLQKFSLDFELEFTYNLDVAVKNNFKDQLTYENFSQGEKKRVDASVMFCFLDFCKLKYNTAKVNVLMFDEFTVGLDPEGEGTFYEILRDISTRENMEVITVSHTTLIDPDKIDHIYNASINSGFSNLVKMEEV